MRNCEINHKSASQVKKKLNMTMAARIKVQIILPTLFFHGVADYY
jgi:hypothetical protein